MTAAGPAPLEQVAQLGGPVLWTWGGFTAIAYSPDGSRIAAAERESIHVFDATTGALVARHPWPDEHGTGEAVSSIAFSPDGRRIAGGGTCFFVNVLDAASGAVVRTFEGRTPVAWLPDGTLAFRHRQVRERLTAVDPVKGGVSGTAPPPLRGVLLADPETGAAREPIVADGSEWEATAFGIDPAGERVVIGDWRGHVRIVDRDTGELRAFFENTSDSFNHPHSIAVSPRGRYICVARTSMLSPELWRAPDGVIDRFLAATGLRDAKLEMESPWTDEEFTYACAPAFSPVGRLMALGGKGAALLVDYEEGLVGRIDLKSCASAVAFSPDGRTLAIVDGWRIRLFETGGGTERQPTAEGHQGQIRAIAFGTAPDGAPELRSACDDGVVRAFDPAGSRPPRRLEDPELAARGAAEEKAEKKWDVADLLDKHTMATAMAKSPDGRLIALGSNARRVRLFDAATRRPVAETPRLDGFARDLAFSPDGTLLASGGSGAVVHLWRVPAP